MIPVVLGPDKRHYVVDHHHLARALHDEGVKDILVTVIADLTMVDRDAFWGVMDNNRWVYPYDAKGERRHFTDIPKTVDQLKDDPFRSLAGELRRVGGFAKDTTPFSEFLWADFLRRRIPRKSVDDNFGRRIEKALAFAKSKDAVYLPGWCGAASDDEGGAPEAGGLLRQPSHHVEFVVRAHRGDVGHPVRQREERGDRGDIPDVVVGKTVAGELAKSASATCAPRR